MSLDLRMMCNMNILAGCNQISIDVYIAGIRPLTRLTIHLWMFVVFIYCIQTYIFAYRHGHQLMAILSHPIYHHPTNRSTALSWILILVFAFNGALLAFFHIAVDLSEGHLLEVLVGFTVSFVLVVHGEVFTMIYHYFILTNIYQFGDIELDLASSSRGGASLHSLAPRLHRIRSLANTIDQFYSLFLTPMICIFLRFFITCLMSVSFLFQNRSNDFIIYFTIEQLIIVFKFWTIYAISFVLCYRYHRLARLVEHRLQRLRASERRRMVSTGSRRLEAILVTKFMFTPLAKLVEPRVFTTIRLSMSQFVSILIYILDISILFYQCDFM